MADTKQINSKRVKERYEEACLKIQKGAPGYIMRAARRVLGDTSDTVWCAGDDTTDDAVTIAAYLLSRYTIEGLGD